MSVIEKLLESGRKRPREDEASSSTCSSSNSSDASMLNATRQRNVTYDLNKRADELSSEISVLYNKFPEMNLIMDSKTLLAHVVTAVEKYKDTMVAQEAEAEVTREAKKCYHEEETVPYNSLPDEVLQNCLSYIGKGHYGSVGLASKKLCKAYVEAFGQETAYLEMATSVKLVDYCFENLCKDLSKDEILKAAAVNGNLDILRNAISRGYDLFPLVEIKKEETYEYYDDTYGEYNEDYHGPCRDSEMSEYMYYTPEDKMEQSSREVRLSQLVVRGHLHVLKYLYEELNYHKGLERYCRPAIQYGQLEILKWLDSIGCMNTDDEMHKFYWDPNIGRYRPFSFCYFAVESGNVEVLEWFVTEVFEPGEGNPLMRGAIRSKSVEMIQYCYDIGYNFEALGIKEAILQTKSLDVYRKVHELGYSFNNIDEWYDQYWEISDSFKFIKYLNSVSTPWSEKVMLDLVEHGTLEMIQFAHDNGCPWSSSGLLAAMLRRETFSYEKFNYLMSEIGCEMDYNSNVINSLCRRKDLEVLGVFVGKNSSLDNALFKSMVECDGLSHYFKPWIEGVTFVLENGKDIQNFQSLEEVFETCRTIDGLKYFHSLGLPWCLDSSRNNRLLSGIACYNKLADVKWAYENGCKGGAYLNEEHIKSSFRDSNDWKVNRFFLEENGLLPEMDIQEIGDAELESEYSSRASRFFSIDYSTLESLVDRGYTFRSQSEKENMIKEGLDKCFGFSWRNDSRKRLGLFHQMKVQEC